MTDEQKRAIEPRQILMLDGEEKSFLLSTWGLKVVTKRLGCSIADALKDRPVEEWAPAILYEALLNRGQLTEEEFEKNLPGNLQMLGETALQLISVSLPAQASKEGAAVNPMPEARLKESPPIQ